jgi:hypothetical protein
MPQGGVPCRQTVFQLKGGSPLLEKLEAVGIVTTYVTITKNMIKED